MNYSMIKGAIDLVEEFENENLNESFSNDIEGFKQWILSKSIHSLNEEDFTYEGKENGRSMESVISTLLVHLNRYAKSYSKSAIQNSVFTTQDEFIFLITLKTFGRMSKMDLIKHNIQDKPNGIQIINRLIKQGFINQENDLIDKRSKILSITELGLEVLEERMDSIRNATAIVSGNLTKQEKMHLIFLLNKLEDFHLPIYQKNIDSKELLTFVNDKILK